MEKRALRTNRIWLLVLSFAVLFGGLTACDQAPTPPPFRTYEEPVPFEPPETDYTLDDAGDSSAE
jgi:hypothetical protein